MSKPKRILICGLNGAGKSTLGRALAEASGYVFRDIEDYYFPKDDPANPYARHGRKLKLLPCSLKIFAGIRT